MQQRRLGLLMRIAVPIVCFVTVTTALALANRPGIVDTVSIVPGKLLAYVYVPSDMSSAGQTYKYPTRSRPRRRLCIRVQFDRSM